jgi:hypothetical protein
MNSLLIPKSLRVSVVLSLSAAALPPHVLAAKAAKSDKAEMRAASGDATADVTATKPGKREGKDPSGAETAAARQLARLRERFGVKDDGEWAVIAERIAKVDEQRRSIVALATGGRGTAAAGERVKRSPRVAASANPEYDALRSAVGEQYPDAEIKSRLARMHDAYEQHEAQLRAAQAELRAVLTIRQEAVAVMAGLLPP